MQAQARTRIRIPRTMRLHERLRITIPLSSIPLPKIHSHRQGLASDARGLASGARGLVLQMPFHLAPDPEGLKALRRAHPWLGLTLRGGTWTLTLPPRPPVAELHLPLVATRRGSSWVTWRPLVTWPPLPMAPIAHGSLPVTVH